MDILASGWDPKGWQLEGIASSMPHLLEADPAMRDFPPTHGEPPSRLSRDLIEPSGIMAMCRTVPFMTLLWNSEEIDFFIRFWRIRVFTFCAYQVGMKIFTLPTLTFLMSVLNSVALDTVLTFDTLSNPFPYNQVIPNGYAGFQWQNFGILDPIDSGPGWDQTGYYYGMISPKNVGFNESAETASMYLASGLFDLDSAYLTAAYSNGLSFSAVGYRNGVAVYNTSYNLSETTPAFIQFNFIGVDKVSFSSSPTQFVIDNILVTTPSTVPEPAGLALIGLAILSMIGLHKTKASSRRS